MKNTEIVQMTSPELEHMIETLQKESLKLKIDGKMGQLKNSARIKAIRKDIARIKTELRKRQFASETVKS
ncbi:MAG TPA: 50S ribosomal protein L29 [Victivallales bacterium]|nr:50S ribosomal protein L29 [Victivallales bacterium]HRU00821.1 50S ribosomal protein L29 [Victivallales bacterium]